MLKIKDPVLLSKQVISVYEVDVGGTPIQVTYCYDDDGEGKGWWDYSLVPAYEGLNDNEIADLEEQFDDVISDIRI